MQAMTGSANMNAEQESALPRAVIHKQILNAAEERPDASMAELSDGINGATVELVERVLDEYGDPAEGTAQQEKSASPGADAPADRSEVDSMLGKNGHNLHTAEERRALTEKQRETLRAICEHPEATQAELADLLGVTAATINTRLNTIENFDWERRDEYVERLGIDTPGEKAASDPDIRDDDGDDASTVTGSSQRQDEWIRGADETRADELQALTREVHELRGRIGQLEACLDEVNGGSSTLADDPEVAHKVLHACLSSGRITEDEELRIMKSLLGQPSQ